MGTLAKHSGFPNCVIKMTSQWAPFVLAHIKENIKTRVTGLCEGNPPVTGGFPSQRASNAENIAMWSRHHDDMFTRIRSVDVWGELNSHHNLEMCW